jgi:molecular chaperone DnaK (HSP70)
MANDRVVGIDLGTTNSLVAYMHGEQPTVIPGEDGSNLVPSLVALDAEEHTIVGNVARKLLIETPERAVYSIKRLMGRGVEDIKDELKLFPFRLAEDITPGEVLRIQLGEQTFTPPEISAFILRQLKRNAERYFGAPVKQAVVTVPAYFNDAQRQATKDAGRIAGLEVLRLVNEPTAAALAYGLDKKKDGVVAVYDLGGGTFDISILKLHDGIFEVIATNGDTHLGGDDIDNLLITIALNDIQGDLGLDLRRSGEAVQAIRKSVIDAKIALSTKESYRFDLELPAGKRYQREITRAQFEQLITPVLQRTVGPCRQAMMDAGLKAEKIDEVVLVGGSTAQFLVQKGSLGSRLPVAAALLAAVTYVLLWLATRSLVLPAKALVMNVLTLSATMGVLVFVFQDGRLQGLLDYKTQGALELTQPVVLFAIAFGLVGPPSS